MNFITFEGADKICYMFHRKLKYPEKTYNHTGPSENSKAIPYKIQYDTMVSCIELNEKQIADVSKNGRIYITTALPIEKATQMVYINTESEMSK